MGYTGKLQKPGENCSIFGISQRLSKIIEKSGEAMIINFQICGHQKCTDSKYLKNLQSLLLILYWFTIFVGLLLSICLSKLALGSTDSDGQCSSAFTISGYDKVNGLYERQADLFNNDVYYVRTEPTTMYAYRNPNDAGKNNWHFQVPLGSKVCTSKYLWTCCEV